MALADDVAALKRGRVATEKKKSGDDPFASRLGKTVVADILGTPGDYESIVHKPYLPTSESLRKQWISGPAGRQNIAERASEFIPDLILAHVMGGGKLATKAIGKTLKMGAAAAGVAELTGSPGLGKAVISFNKVKSGIKGKMKKIPKGEAQAIVDEAERAHGVDLSGVRKLFTVGQAAENFGKVHPRKGFIDAAQLPYEEARRDIASAIRGLYSDETAAIITKKPKLIKKALEPLRKAVIGSLTPSSERSRLVSDIDKIGGKRAPNFSLNTLLNLYSLKFNRMGRQGNWSQAGMKKVRDEMRTLIRSHGGETGEEFLGLMGLLGKVHNTFQTIADPNGNKEFMKAAAKSRGAGELFLQFDAMSNILTGNIVQGAAKLAALHGTPYPVKTLTRHMLNPDESPIKTVLEIAHTISRGDKKGMKTLLKALASGLPFMVS